MNPYTLQGTTWAKEAYLRMQFPKAYAFLDGFEGGFTGMPCDFRGTDASRLVAYKDGHELGIEQAMREWEDYILETCDTVRELPDQ